MLAYEVHLPEGVSNVDDPFACYAYVSNTGNEGDDGDNRMNGSYSMASSEDSSYPSVYLYEEESSTYYYSPINSMRVELSGSTITLSQDHHQELIPSHGSCMVQIMVIVGLFLMNNQISHSVQVKPNTSLFDPIQGVTIITS